MCSLGVARVGAAQAVARVRPAQRRSAVARAQVFVVWCRGTLASNGAKFDSSRDRGKPFRFVIGIGQVQSFAPPPTHPPTPRVTCPQVIRGWDEGVIQMSLGERATLNISADYGCGGGGAAAAGRALASRMLDFDLY